MPAPISVIIPTLNAAEGIGLTLGALTEGLGAGLIREVIISDGGSADSIATIAEAWGAEFIEGPPGRGGQLRRAAEQATGAWLLVLHADSVPAPGWSEAVLEHISHGVERAGYFDLRFDSGGPGARLVAGWANLRARLFGLPFGDQGLLLPVSLYRRVGGYPDIPLMEDVAIARALTRLRLTPLSHPIETSAERYRANGWLRRGARNLWTLLRFLLGADPERLARRYIR